MIKRLTLSALAAAALAAASTSPARAQAVETPQPFDSAGRVMAITPAIAAKLGLIPPAWRVTGDYAQARLYALGDGAFVLVVTRRGGSVERYALTASDRDYLRTRTSTLPPTVEEEVEKQVGHAARRTLDTVARSAFIRNQTVLGLVLYGPLAATAMTTDDAGRAATYLLVAGGTFFGASELSRDIVVSQPMNQLATHAALRGTLAGTGLVYAVGGRTRGQAAAAFAGGLAGTGLGLWAGRGMNDGEATASGFGSDVAALVTFALIRPHYGTNAQGDEYLTKSQAGLLVGVGLTGYPLGAWYARRAPYDVTGGDVHTMWVTGAIGALASSAFIVGNDPSESTTAYTLTSGFLVGVVAGDRLLVRRIDHTRPAAATIGLGAVAGGLMGAGVFVLTSRNRNNDVLAVTMGTLGAVGGVALSERLFPSEPDARRSASRVEFTPAGLALAAAGLSGRFPVLHVSF